MEKVYANENREGGAVTGIAARNRVDVFVFHNLKLVKYLTTVTVQFMMC